MSSAPNAPVDERFPLPGPPEATRRRQRNALPESVDVVIIGCGLAGLTAGAFLAKAGKTVACLEAHYIAGGCGTVFSRSTEAGKYNFDVGLHYVGDCGPTGTLPTILREAGCAPVTWLPLDPDGFDTIVVPGLEFKIPVGIDNYERRLLETFPGEARGIKRYVAFVKGVAEVGGLLEKNRGKMSAGILWKILSRHRLLARYQKATIGEFLDSCTSNEQLRAVFLGQHGDYGLPPSRVSALLHAGLANHYFTGAFYPEGGGQTLADRLGASIEAHGGSIHLSRAVGRILVEGGRAIGVETAPKKNRPTEQVRAKVVISAADLEKTLRELLPAEALPQQWRERLNQGYEHTAALFITCLGIKGDLRDLGMRNSNYWISPNCDVEGLYSSLKSGPPKATAAYITSASLKDPDNPHHAPAGHHSIEVMTILSGRPEAWGLDAGEEFGWGYKRNDVYHAHKQRIEDELIAMLDARFPGAAERIVYRESASPMSHIRFTNATAGSAYGIGVTPEQFGTGRPGYSAVIPGLHLAGVSTRDGHGIVGAMSSGRSAARAALKALG